MKFKPLNPEDQMLLELNEFIHPNYEYHKQHIQLVRDYALLLNKRTHSSLNVRKLSYAALAHDLFKEKDLDPSKPDREWKGHVIPQDINRYVRMNLNVIEEFGLDDFFNTDIQYHPLAAGIFLIKEFGIRDLEILYPVFFHSCPIIEIYETLPHRVRQSVNILMLADKLSSNWLRINFRETEVRTDLDLVVFGAGGYEFNYTLGLLFARLISQGKSTEKQSTIATKYFYDLAAKVNPMLTTNYSIKKLGGSTIWPKRKSQAFRMR